MRCISHPFRLGPTGRVVTVDQDSDQFVAEQIAVLLTTRPGERALEPSFGLPDPAFDGIDPSLVQAAVTAFVPSAQVSDVTVTYRDDSTADVRINYSIGEATGDIA